MKSKTQTAIKQGELQYKLSLEVDALLQSWLNNPKIPVQILNDFSANPIFPLISELKNAGFEVSDKIVFSNKNVLPMRSIVVTAFNPHTQAPITLLNVTLNLMAEVKEDQIRAVLYGKYTHVWDACLERPNTNYLYKLFSDSYLNDLESNIYTVISQGYAAPQNPPLVKSKKSSRAFIIIKFIEGLLYRRES